MTKNLLKLHLYLVEIHGYTYRVLTLRPSEKVRFSNNFYHETWHLLTDSGGAEILAQLLWGMAFQKRPGTLLLFDDPHLTQTPFEADKPKPCIVAPVGLTCLEPDMLRAMRRKLSQMKAPSATVKWQTFGLDKEDESDKKVYPFDQELEHLWHQERMELRGGHICYTAPPFVLQRQALSVRRVSKHLFYGSNYTYLAEGNGRKRHHADGEVQIFADFEDRVAAAIQARERILVTPGAIIEDYTTREKIYAKTEVIATARKAARKGKKRRKGYPTELSGDNAEASVGAS